MDKIGMREWVSGLEQVIDNRLSKWKKCSRIENGEALQVEWLFGQTHIILDIFWEDGQETVQFLYHHPRTGHRYTWHGLTDETFNKIQDRIGNLAQMAMYPLDNYK